MSIIYKNEIDRKQGEFLNKICVKYQNSPTHVFDFMNEKELEEYYKI
uniref:Uncharacterized protein n=1 Tax=viral metagenome TaxID=1070528 RepID=A0A6M3LTP5_9ZZZZ